MIICKSVGVFCPGSVPEHPKSHSRVKKDIETIGTFVQIITIVLSFVLIFFLLEEEFFAALNQDQKNRTLTQINKFDIMLDHYIFSKFQFFSGKG